MTMAYVGIAMGVATVGSAIIGSNAAKSAANTQAAAANNAAQIGQNEFNTITQQEQPFLQSGYGAQSQLNYLLGIGPTQGQQAPGQAGAPWAGGGGQPTGATAQGGHYVTHMVGNVDSKRPVRTWVPDPTGAASGAVQPQGAPGANGGAQGANGTPGMTPTTSSTAGGFGSLLSPFTADTFKQYSPAYQFQLQQGQQGVLNGASSSAGALSGAAQKDLMDYNQQSANTAFNNAFNQYQTQQGNIYNRLAGVAQLGQNAAANTGQQGTALAGQVAQSVTNAGTAAAAGQVGQANAWSGAINNAVPWLMANTGGGSGSAGYGLVGKG